MSKDDRRDAILIKVIAVLSVFQLYPGNLLHFDISSSMLAGLLSAGLFFFPSALHDRRSILLVGFIGLKILYALASSLQEGIHDIVLLLPFCGSFALARNDTKQDMVWKALKITVILGCLQSLAVIIFRLSPSLENHFWRSPLAVLTIGSAGMTSFNAGTIVNNVISPSKAGGFCLNANPAGAWSLSMFFITLALYRRFTYRLTAALVLLCHFLAIALCGSKASLIIVVAVPAIWLGLLIARRAPLLTRTIIPIPVLLAVPATIIGIEILLSTHLSLSGFRSDSETTLATRVDVWEIGWRYFKSHPIIGLGYGGWMDHRLGEVLGLQRIATRELLLPPHNSLLALWSVNGAIGLILALWFLLPLLIKGLWRAALLDVPAFGMTSAMLATFLQSQGENFSMFGDVHTVSLLGLTAGCIARLLDAPCERTRSTLVHDAHSSLQHSCSVRRSSLL